MIRITELLLFIIYLLHQKVATKCKYKTHETNVTSILKNTVEASIILRSVLQTSTERE